MTGWNGDPDAKTALPSVYLYASSAVHSAFEVGFERAKMIGRSLKLAIALIISGVNAPPIAAAPINTVGSNCFRKELN